MDTSHNQGTVQHPIVSGAGDVHVLLPGLQADQLRADLVGEEEDPGGQHLPTGPGR